MADVRIEAELDLSDVKRDIDQQVETILQDVVKRVVPEALREAQRDGFPEDEDDYVLLLRNRGRESRRKLASINTRYLKIGTKRSPLEFKFVSTSGGFASIVPIAIKAYLMARKRAPYDEGDYLQNLGLFVGDSRYQVAVTIAQLRTFKFASTDSIFIASPVPYASTIEAGFYKGYYQDQTRSGGIMLHATRSLRKLFGSKAAIRHRYISMYVKYQVPVIEIAPLGAFASNDVLPGKAESRRRRRKRGRR